MLRSTVPFCETDASYRNIADMTNSHGILHAWYYNYVHVHKQDSYLNKILMQLVHNLYLYDHAVLLAFHHH